MEKKYSLPKMEFPFEIQSVGQETGINWVGKFKYKRPTLGARSRIAALKSRLNGDIENLNIEVEEFNHAASYLRHTLVEYPQWWEEAAFGLELYDGNIISEVYNKCMEFEVEFKKRIHSGDSKDVGEEGSASLKEFTNDVGREIKG